MIYILLITVLSVSGYVFHRAWKGLSRSSWSTQAKLLTFVVITSLGGALGVWSSERISYKASSTIRFQGVPIPVAVFVKEEGQWSDFVHATPVTLAIVITNSAALSALFLWLFTAGRHATSHRPHLLLTILLNLVWFLFGAPFFLETASLNDGMRRLMVFISPLVITGGILYPCAIFQDSVPLVRILKLFAFSFLVLLLTVYVLLTGESLVVFLARSAFWQNGAVTPE